jgi:DNA-binding beta-propeller fold protein YncE
VNVGEPLSMAGLRGRVVVLHFFTGSCVHCQRVVRELRGLEARSGADLVLIGVRTPRFDHERAAPALAASVARLRISHPVVDDPQAAAWDRYGVRAWPTVVVVDRAGYVVGSARGEGVGPAVEQAVEAALTGAGSSPSRAASTRIGAPSPGGRATSPAPVARDPDATPDPPGEVHAPVRPHARSGPAGELDSPAKVAVHPEGVVLADTAHDRVLVVRLDGGIVAEHLGVQAPHGVRATPDGSLLVCERDADRVVRLPAGGGKPRLVLGDVASPWDVAAGSDGNVFVAEAGRHRIWRITPDGGAAVLAGTGEEGLEDGYGPKALFAQPSGLALGPQGLFVVDAEASALRVIDAQNRVATLVGRGTSTWGAADGPAATALLQHPQGVAAAPDGYSIYVADTFNSSLRLWSGVDGELRTAPVEGLLEPGGLDVLPDGRLVVADTGNHRIVMVDLAAGTVTPVPLA